MLPTDLPCPAWVTGGASHPTQSEPMDRTALPLRGRLGAR